MSPDILLLQGVDYDHGLATLGALRDWLGESGADYPEIFALAPNTGLESGYDLDGDGRCCGPGDAQGYGEFFGQGGMALLSRHEIEREAIRDFSAFLWRDLPGAILPEIDGEPFPSADARNVQRLSSVGHWVVPVRIGEARLTLLAFHAAPPVFDGPEDRNGRRNHDELIFWRHYLDGTFGAAPMERFVVIGDANLDPVDGDGRREALAALLRGTGLRDARPQRPEGPLEDHPGHDGDPRLDTVAWPAPDPGHLRVDYILTSADLTVARSAVHWPAGDGAAARDARAASRHRMVWIDILLD